MNKKVKVIKNNVIDDEIEFSGVWEIDYQDNENDFEYFFRYASFVSYPCSKFVIWGNEDGEPVFAEEIDSTKYINIMNDLCAL